MNMWIRDHAIGTTSDYILESSFWLPEQDAPSAWLGHAPFAFWITNILKPRTFVELGVHTGFSYLVFCQAVRALKIECKCSGIDTWQGDEHAGFYGEEIYESMIAKNRRHASFSQLIRSTFEDAVSQFADGSVDLLHIDGRHHYDDVRSDFESWKPKLSNRAVVLFHDTNVASFGVKKLWDELSEEYPHFAFHHSHGLGVLGVGDDLPSRLRRLFTLPETSEESQSVRTVYERLGDSITQRQQITALEHTIHSYRASFSWRVTKPLRGFAGLVRRGLKKAKHVLQSAPTNSKSSP